MIDILFDDLISSLKFFNRRQLLRFCRANRFTLNIVENYFAEWPAIFSELEIVNKAKNNTDDEREGRLEDGRLPLPFFMELKAINCDCEQELSANINEFCTYKMVTNCKCKRKNTLGLFDDDENEKKEMFELEAYKNCKDDWHPMGDPNAEIPEFREHYSSRLSRLFYKSNEHSPTPNKCCQFYSHKVHDQISQNSIAKEYIFAHRDQINVNGTFGCICPTALFMQTTNMDKIIPYLKMDFIKIYKFHFQQELSNFYYYGQESEPEMERQNSDSQQCLQILQWILENKKITNATSCIVDVELIDELLGIMAKNGEGMKPEILLDLLGKCGHLKLTAKKCAAWKNLSLLPGLHQILQNSVMLTTACTLLFLDFNTIETFLKLYNPQNDHRRFWLLEQQQIDDDSHNSFDLADNLIQSFLNATMPNTYFILCGSYFPRGKFRQQKYYNATTEEYLRVMPAFWISYTNFWIPVYLARYSKLSTIADEEFESFFEEILQRMQKNEKNKSRNQQNESKEDYTMIEHEEVICSFSAYLAKVFPGFSLNIGGQQKNAAAGYEAFELYNGKEITIFRKN